MQTPMQKKIVQRGDEYCVVTTDGSTLGCHPTRDEALEQLRAVEANKGWPAHLVARLHYDAGEELKTFKTDEILKYVPPIIPHPASVVFVTGAPSAIEAARGEPFVGLDGRTFNEKYLGALGLKRQDVGLMHLVPKQLEKGESFLGVVDNWLHITLPMIPEGVEVVAVGKQAKQVLGDRATVYVPHPGSVRRVGDSGEVARKMRRLSKRLTSKAQEHTIQRDETPSDTGRVVNLDQVDITKVDEDQVVFGVVLTPYVIDTQGDWVPPADIEKAAERFLAESRVIGLQHQDVLAEAKPVQSYVWPYPSPEDKEAAFANRPHRAYRQKYGNGVVRSGEWIMGTKIDNEMIWQAVKSGELGSYSIGGFGVRVPIEQSDIPAVEFIDVE
jgi:uracil-DNA glycosylase family 4